MKKLVFSALLLLVGACLFTSCTTVPRDNNSSTTNTSTSRTYSK